MHDIINSDAADHQREGEDECIFENSGIRIEGSLSVHQKHGNLEREELVERKHPTNVSYLFAARRGQKERFAPHQHARGVSCRSSAPVEPEQWFIFFAQPVFIALNQFNRCSLSPPQEASSLPLPLIANIEERSPTRMIFPYGNRRRSTREQSNKQTVSTDGQNNPGGDVLLSCLLHVYETEFLSISSRPRRTYGHQ